MPWEAAGLGKDAAGEVFVSGASCARTIGEMTAQPKRSLARLTAPPLTVATGSRSTTLALRLPRRATAMCRAVCRSRSNLNHNQTMRAGAFGSTLSMCGLCSNGHIKDEFHSPTSAKPCLQLGFVAIKGNLELLEKLP